METTLSPTRNRRSGFWNLLARENKVWWGGRQWWLHALLGVVGLDGFLALILFVLPGAMAEAGETMEPLVAGVQLFFGLGSFALALDAIILTQDTIIGERESGVAEWVLSKPVSRSAYLCAKLLANAVGLLVTLVLLPGLVAYALLSLAAGDLYPAVPFITGLVVLALHTLFYLTLSLMMGTLAERRGILLAVTLGSLLGGALAVDLLRQAALVTPWFLPNIAAAFALGAPFASELVLPVGMTVVLTCVAFAVGLWRFQSVEL